MKAGYPDGSFGSDLRCHHAVRISRLAPPGRRPGLLHRYQPSIQLVTCIVALATCFSTVLMLN